MTTCNNSIEDVSLVPVPAKKDNKLPSASYESTGNFDLISDRKNELYAKDIWCCRVVR